MAKHSQVTIPHLGIQFDVCVESLEDLMKEAVRHKLDVDQKRALVVWNDAENNPIEINTEKAFQTYLKMPQTKLTIKHSVEDPIKITFIEIKQKSNIVYSFATTYYDLFVDLDLSFGIRFPNDQLSIYWTDHDGDFFYVTGEKTFEMFLNHGSRHLQVASISRAIMKGHNEPVKVIMATKTMTQKQYIDSATDWKEMLKEIEKAFDMAITARDYRLYWKCYPEEDEKMFLTKLVIQIFGDNDDDYNVEITDDTTYMMFLEKSKNRKLFIKEKSKILSIIKDNCLWFLIGYGALQLFFHRCGRM